MMECCYSLRMDRSPWRWVKRLSAEVRRQGAQRKGIDVYECAGRFKLVQEYDDTCTLRFVYNGMRFLYLAQTWMRHCSIQSEDH
jgi:hypothetical protein